MVQMPPVLRRHQRAAHCKDGGVTNVQTKSLLIPLNRNCFGFQLRKDSIQRGTKSRGIIEKRVVLRHQVVVINKETSHIACTGCGICGCGSCRSGGNGGSELYAAVVSGRGRANYRRRRIGNFNDLLIAIETDYALFLDLSHLITPLASAAIFRYCSGQCAITRWNNASARLRCPSLKAVTCGSPAKQAENTLPCSSTPQITRRPCSLPMTKRISSMSRC
nr:MAG TPA: hypothetical protein [Caudoviricetes sp.]